METIHRMTVKDLATAYRVHRNTMYRWLRRHENEIGRRQDNSHYYSVGQVRKIFEIFDVPEGYEPA